MSLFRRTEAVSEAFVHSFFCNSLINLGAVCKPRRDDAERSWEGTLSSLYRHLNKEDETLSGHSDFMLLHYTVIL